MATNQQKFDDTHEHAQYLDMKVSDVAMRILGATIKRGGKEVTVLQEIADSVTLGRENKAAIAALTALVGQLATGQDVDYERIKQDTRDVLATETVTVTLNVNPKEQP